MCLAWLSFPVGIDHRQRSVPTSHFARPASGLIRWRSQAHIELPENGAVSTGRRNTGLKFTGPGLKAQGFSRSLVQAHRYFVEFRLGINR